MATSYTDQVQKVYIAYYGRAADPVGLAYWAAKVETDGLAGIMASFGASAEATTLYGSLSNTAKVNALYQQSFGRDADLAGLLYYSGALSDGTMTAASIAQNIYDGAAGTDVAILTNKLAVAKAYTAEITTASEVLAYTGTVSAAAARATLSSVDGATVTASFDVATAIASLVTVYTTIAAPAAQTIALTTSTDNIKGGAGDEIINGPLSSTTMTFDSLDAIDGGAGIDTLAVSINAANTYQAGSMTNVEKVIVSSTAAGTLSLLGTTGVTDVKVNAATATTTVSNINEGANLDVTNTGNQSVTFSSATGANAGAADAVSLNLSSLSHTDAGGKTIAIPTAIETVSINASGTNVADTINTGTATTLNVSGTGSLEIFEVTDAQLVTLDASGLTGALKVEGGTGITTITGGAGNDTVDVLGTAQTSTIVLGAGNDTVKFNATGTLTTADTVTGGAGTDTISNVTAEWDGYTTGTLTKVTGFEKATVTDAVAGNIDFTAIAGIKTATLATATDNTARTITMEAGDITVNLGASLLAGLVVTDTGTAITDTLTIKNSNTTADDMGNGMAVTSTGYESVTIDSTAVGTTSQTFGAIIVTPDATGASSLTFTGADKVTVAAITATTIDASGLTAAGSGSTFTMSAAAITVTTITGSEGNDTLVGDAASTINGGGGIDTITGGSGNDTIDGGAGNDLITTNAGVDNIQAGAGDDTITFAGNYASGDVVDGGAGTDILSLTSAGVAVIDGYAISAATILNNNLSNVEKVLVTDIFNTGVDLDMARLDSMTYIDLDAAFSGNETISGLANNTTVVIGAAINQAADILTLTLADATAETDVLTLVLDNNAAKDHGVVSLTNIETVNIIATEETAAAVQIMTIDLTLSGVDNLIISGKESVTSGAAIAATTIDASGLTAGAFVMNATASGLSQTITGSALGADTLYGGGGSDTIIAAAGGDGIFGGAGSDTITAGEGADTITGGSGNDTIDLTEVTEVLDDVVLLWSESGTYIDTITGFNDSSMTGTVDELQIDLSAFNLIGASGGVNITSATVLTQFFDGTAVGAAAGGVQVSSGTTIVADGKDVIIMQGSAISSEAEVEDALETGGSFELTVSTTNTHIVQYDSIVVVYSDGTDAHVAIAVVVTDPGTLGTFSAAELDVVDIAIIAGVSSIGSTTFATANFEFI